MQIKLVIFTFYVIGNAFSACLDPSTLGHLGFTKLLDTPEKSSDYCKGTYDVEGSCVDPSEAKEVMEEINSLLKKGYGIVGKLDDFVKEVEDLIRDVLTNVQDQSVIEALEFSIEFFKSQLDEHKDECLEEMAKLQRGYVCYATSANASEFAVDTDEKLTIKGKKGTFGSLDKCFSIYSTLCLLSLKNNPITLAASSAEDFMSVNPGFDQRCFDLVQKIECDGEDITKCLSQGHLIAEFFFEYNDITFYPTEEQVEEITQLIEKTAELLEELRDVIQPDGDKSSLTASGVPAIMIEEEGVYLIQLGEDSGVEFESVQLISLLKVSLIALFFVYQ